MNREEKALSFGARNYTTERGSLMYELNYIQARCPEEEITDELKFLGRSLMSKLKNNFINDGDCSALAATQVGLKRNFCCLYSISKKEWFAAANPVIMETKGEATELQVSLVTHKDKYILRDLYPSVTVEFDDLDTGTAHRLEISGQEAVTWQMMTALLDGVELNVVEKDYRTIRGSDRAKPNKPCECGSGKKAKKCCHRQVLV